MGSSNPQILYTPQQQMGYGGFSVPCRVGNWAEDEYLGVLGTADHVAKQTAGMCTSQQLGSVLGQSMKPVELAPAPSDGAIRYGDVVMLSAALGGVVALDVTMKPEDGAEAHTVLRSQEQGAVACARTAWTVTAPANTQPPADGILRIGAPFCLSVSGGYGSSYGSSLYLQSMRYTLTNQNLAKTSGQRKQGVCAVAAPSADTLWKVCVLDPTDLAQMESEGRPVPSNTFVSICHVNTQTPLHTGPMLLASKYGGEYEVSAFHDGSVCKAAFGARKGKMLEPGNHFAFTTAEAA